MTQQPLWSSFKACVSNNRTSLTGSGKSQKQHSQDEPLMFLKIFVILLQLLLLSPSLKSHKWKVKAYMRIQSAFWTYRVWTERMKIPQIVSLWKSIMVYRLLFLVQVWPTLLAVIMCTAFLRNDRLKPTFQVCSCSVLFSDQMVYKLLACLQVWSYDCLCWIARLDLKW